jgi:hypothetical protein
MQLREMRFAKIEGVEVKVEVASETEAKSAIRELRHKKKELALLKRRLLKEQSAAKRAHSREDRERKRAAQRRGVFAALKRVSRVFRSKKPTQDLLGIERDIDHADEILHNIDSCIIQLEGKLLS